MTNQPVSLSPNGPPETVLPEFNPKIEQSLQDAVSVDPLAHRQKVFKIVSENPTFLAGWATIGDLSAPGIEAYMAYRVGYHRGLDSLRANNWRGSGYVRWKHLSNRGFLRCLGGLAKHARIIGEDSESVRCEQFLIQLDPSGEAKHLVR